MINYELALKLKEAGFPQQTLLGIWKDATEPMRLEDCPKTWGDTLACPTLEELIEACGEPFFQLEKLKDGWGCNDHYRATTGKTPEEAVANLWLALNKKS